MPLYEFRCKTCKNVFEKLVPSSTAELPACPQCGAPEVSKLLSAFAVQGGSAGGGMMSGGGPSGGCHGGGCGCH